MSGPKRVLVGYDECRCILTQYCDDECRPVFADRPLRNTDAPKQPVAWQHAIVGDDNWLPCTAEQASLWADGKLGFKVRALGVVLPSDERQCLPSLPKPLWTVGGVGVFTEHQMQSYANAALALKPDARDVAPALYSHVYEWDYSPGVVHRSFSSAPYNGRRPDCTVEVFSAPRTKP